MFAVICVRALCGLIVVFVFSLVLCAFLTVCHVFALELALCLAFVCLLNLLFMFVVFVCLCLLVLHPCEFHTFPVVFNKCVCDCVCSHVSSDSAVAFSV